MGFLGDLIGFGFFIRFKVQFHRRQAVADYDLGVRYVLFGVEDGAEGKETTALGLGRLLIVEGCGGHFWVIFIVALTHQNSGAFSRAVP